MSASTTDYALMLAARGCKVFRIKAGTKDFFIDKAWADAPLDTFDIVDAFTRNDGSCVGYNYGVNAGASDLVIVDVDLKPPLDGFANLATLGALPRTFTVRSPSGGKHFYFRANGLKLTQRPLCPGVDIRSFHGYVVGPGSRTDKGAYEIEDDSDFAELPEWIRGRAKEAGTRGQLPPLFEPDSEPEAIEDAIDFLRAQPIARAGARNNVLADVIRAVFDFGVSVETAAELLDMHFSCDPPVCAEEIVALCERLDESYEGPRGKEFSGYGFTPVTLGGPKPATLETLAGRFAARLSPLEISERHEDIAPLRPWRMKPYLLDGKVSEIVAPGAAGKSLLTAQWACALALGKEVAERLGCDVTEPCNVLLINNEDEIEEINRRIIGICKHFNLDRKKVAERVFVLSGAEDPLTLIARTGKNKLEPTPEVEELVAFITLKNIRVTFADPLVEFHEADENSNGEMSIVMKNLRPIAVRTKSSLCLIHHTSKPGNSDQSGNANAARGASTVINAARAAATLFSMSEKDAEKYGVSADMARWYLRLDNAKANLTGPSSGAQWFKRVSVELSNKEQVGVLEPTKLEAAEKGDRNMMALEIAPSLAGGNTMSVAEASRLLAECDMFKGFGASALAKRISKAFVSGEEVEVPGGRLQFISRGKEGGEFTLLN